MIKDKFSLIVYISLLDKVRIEEIMLVLVYGAKGLIVDPEFTWQNFSLEEQSRILDIGRNNNYLDTSKLEAEFQILPIEIRTGVIKYFLEKFD